MSPAYPTSLPIVDIQNIITTIETGALASKRAAFAKSVWVLLGYGLNETLGDVVLAPAPSNPNTRILSDLPALVSSGRNLTNEEVCELLRPLAFQSVTGAEIITDILKKIPWAEVIAWAVKIIPTLFVG